MPGRKLMSRETHPFYWSNSSNWDLDEKNQASSYEETRWKKNELKLMEIFAVLDRRELAGRFLDEKFYQTRQN